MAGAFRWNLDNSILASHRAGRKGAMRPGSSERRKTLHGLICAAEPEFVSSLRRWQEEQPDPIKNPARYALVQALIYRLEKMLSFMRSDVEAAIKVFEEHSAILPEIEELENWLTGKNRMAEGGKVIEANKETVGNWLSVAGFLYTDIVSMLDKATKRKRGAPPTLKPETLRAYDLRLHERLSYSKIVAQVCVCGKKKHDKHCQDSLRHRFRELETVLSKYGFQVLDDTDKTP